MQGPLGEGLGLAVPVAVTVALLESGGVAEGESGGAMAVDGVPDGVPLRVGVTVGVLEKKGAANCDGEGATPHAAARRNAFPESATYRGNPEPSARGLSASASPRGALTPAAAPVPSAGALLGLPSSVNTAREGNAM